MMQPGEVSATSLERIQEVVDLMAEIYMMLVKMRWIPASAIKRAPHVSPPINITLAQSLGLSPEVIELHQRLPYIDRRETDSFDFIFGGTFADFRDAEDVIRSRDPFYWGLTWDEEEGRYIERYERYKEGYDEEKGAYVRPWVTPLSMMGNHQAVIIYDLKNHRIWIIDQECWTSVDPGARDLPQGEQGYNQHTFDHIPSRPAPDVLKDILEGYRSLQYIPGDSENGYQHFDHDDFKHLYLSKGWPSAFDGLAFDIARVRYQARAQAASHAAQPLRDVETKTQWHEHEAAQLARREEELRVRMAANAGLDEEWTLKFEIKKSQLTLTWVARGKAEAEAEAGRKCPGGVYMKDEEKPGWEVRMLRDDVTYKKNSIKAYEEWIAGAETPEKVEAFRLGRQKDQAALKVLEAALAEAEEEAERVWPGCEIPGRDDEVEKPREIVVESDEYRADREEHIAAIRTFLETVPVKALGAREKIMEEVRSRERDWGLNTTIM